MKESSKLNEIIIKIKINNKKINTYHNMVKSNVYPYIYFLMFICLCGGFIYYMVKSYKKINDIEYLKYIGTLILYYILIEDLFFDRDSTYFNSIILWHSSLKHYFMKNVDSLSRYIKISNKQYINKLIITNIEIIGIILSESGIVLNRSVVISHNLNIINTFIISILLFVTLITFIRSIRIQFSHDIVYLQIKHKVNISLPNNLRDEKSLEDKRIKDTKQDLIYDEIDLTADRYWHWRNIRKTIGKDFDYITDNMF